ncbi:MAG: endonuclease/exonuclease/phosphatase family protein [Gemmatimonadaceae bacterium]|nr:endonuclease/exonuclease/phosphatase family protein [Gemmatimonadaceae bacterium]
MRKTFIPMLALALGACASTRTAGVSPAAAAGGVAGTPLRVMTFNIRYNNPGDGINAWPNRKAWVAQLIRFHDADVVGVQEALHGMLVDLDSLLPEYSRVGVGRKDGKEAGEYSAILYKKTRVEMLENKTFWLSTNPDAVGVKAWDAALERIATWGKFRDRATGCTYVHLNTHFDHVGQEARKESAKLIRRQLRTIAGNMPHIVTGDLNVGPTTEAYTTLTSGAVEGGVAPLIDGYVSSREGSYGPNASFNSFKEIGDTRIDYVMVSQGIDVLKHGILTDRWDKRFPSDHMPVIASLSMRCK